MNKKKIYIYIHIYTWEAKLLKILRLVFWKTMLVGCEK